MKLSTCGLLGALVYAVPCCLWAGPPFITDDPEPVPFHHWEIYLASQHAETRDGWSGTLPFIDANYGAFHDIHLHVATPMNYIRPDQGPHQYGYGDTEVGAKIRFLQETDNRPQAAIYPALEIPTGNEHKGLGSGHTQFFLPVWIQKSWSSWTSYGGGGYWVNPGAGNRNWVYLGWELQRDLSKQLMLGTEIYHRTAATEDESAADGFNIGTQFNLSDIYHLLFSAGRDTNGPNRFISYLGLQWTYPPESEAPTIKTK